MEEFTAATYFFDYEHPEIQEFLQPYKALTPKAQLQQLYLRIRDGWRYNPFKIGITKDHYQASTILSNAEGHCIDKAIVLITCYRALAIPARLRLAKVSNHIATEHLERILGTNELAPHGVVEVFYSGKWVKCVPAFNRELCAKYQVDVLDFDGSEDAVIQEYNRNNEQFMSYLEDYGSYQDVPFERMMDIFRANYPEIYEKNQGNTEVNFFL
ncbi:Transglutaminase-like domain [Tenacibaculum litopenaei]|uniref:transglutaminase-like domain-containing protein n=1 Tax=Tenacibaculum litopenaei TaxID=396016 RepID=UPI00389319FF